MKRIYFVIFSFFLLIAAVLTADFFSLPPNAAANSDAVTFTVKISVCGNGEKEYGEQCDGSDLAGASCLSRGFSSGTLSCSPACEFNTSGCVSASSCGNGSCAGSETCSSCPADCGTCPSGGGGGGGGYVAPATNVIFSGRAYPKSAVTLLKDAQIAATTVAGADANFSITLSGLSAGNYIFSLYSEDNKGVRSSLLTFPSSVTTGATTNVGGIFIAPTIAVDKSEVKRGDNLAIFGQSAPQADMVISVNSEEEFFGKTISDKDGIYLYNFDTSILDYGTHNTKAKASIGNQLVSSWSYLVGFKVGAKSVVAEPEKKVLKGNLNNDNRVNLIDFSIVAYWYKRPNPPVAVDLNNDNKVDLVDFSIMAYYWTG